MKPNSGAKPEKSWPAETFAPLSPPVRLLTRSDDCQIRLNYLGNLGGVDLRIFRKSPAETDDLEAYAPTNAGLVVPKEQLREFIGLLTELAAELER